MEFKKWGSMAAPAHLDYEAAIEYWVDKAERHHSLVGISPSAEWRSAVRTLMKQWGMDVIIEMAMQRLRDHGKLREWYAKAKANIRRNEVEIAGEAGWPR